MRRDPIVLCIVGKGRSGSTLLDTILGQLDGFFSTGELRRLWEWGLTEGYRCGCGARVLDCATWGRIVARTVAGDPSHHAAQVVAWQRDVLSWARIPRLLRQRPGRVAGWPELRAYTDHLSRTYRAIAEVTGADVIVDSTKWPAAPTPLGLVPGVRVRVVQLVRDPRAVTFSWRRRKRWRDRPGDQEMPRYGPVFSMASWWARNLTAELVRRRHPAAATALIRYEDLVTRPRSTVAAVAALAGAGSARLPFLDDGTVELGRTHTVGGNPARLLDGPVRLRLDDQWREDQPAPDRLLASVLGAPLLGRYGYPLSPVDGGPRGRVAAAGRQRSAGGS